MAELADIFKPPPPPPRENSNRKRKAQAQAGQEGGENGEAGGAKKKKRKKNDNANPDDPNAPPKPKRVRPSKAKAKKGPAANGTAADDHHDPLLNLSPSEAARRRDEANKRLSEAGIDPVTLSAEQFDIFSNQSPDLQKESLAMLVKYGAERLRIVHPNKDNNNTSANASPTNGAATPDGGSGKKKKSKKKALNEDGTPRVKVKKYRGKCQACTAKKQKVRFV